MSTWRYEQLLATYAAELESAVLVAAQREREAREAHAAARASQAAECEARATAEFKQMAGVAMERTKGLQEERDLLKMRFAVKQLKVRQPLRP